MSNNQLINFGMFSDELSYHCVTTANGIEGYREQAKKRQYVKHYLNDAENLYGVQSEFAGLPNFMVWSTDATWVDLTMEPLPIDAIIGNTRRYVANMTEEELELFLPVFQQICSLYKVYCITINGHAFEMHITINGQPKRLLVSVMNMIDFERDPNAMRHWWGRDTLN